MLLDEVRSSIDYYRNQPGLVAAAPHRRDRRRGAAPGIDRAAVGARRRAGRAGPPARARRARRHRLLRRGAPAPRSVSPGRGRSRARRRRRRHRHRPAAAGTSRGSSRRAPADRTGARRSRGVFVVLLGGFTFLANQSVSHAKSQREGPRQVTDVNGELASLQPILSQGRPDQRITSNLQTLLTTDVAWQTMINRITAKLPAGITLTSFSGQVTPPAPVVQSPTPTHAELRLGFGASSETTTRRRSRRRRRRRRSPARSRSRAPRRTIRRSRVGSTRWARCRRSANVYVTAAQKVPVERQRRRRRHVHRRPRCRRPQRRAIG